MMSRLGLWDEGKRKSSQPKLSKPSWDEKDTLVMRVPGMGY